VATMLQPVLCVLTFYSRLELKLPIFITNRLFPFISSLPSYRLKSLRNAFTIRGTCTVQAYESGRMLQYFTSFHFLRNVAFSDLCTKVLSETCWQCSHAFCLTACLTKLEETSLGRQSVCAPELTTDVPSILTHLLFIR
jgi:hypothetical protein